MSEILVIVPSEWVLQDTDTAVNFGGMSVDWYAQLGQATTDLNATLRANGYFPEGSNAWVQDVLVVAGNVYFKFDIIRD
jgi:hypothetical protein